MHLSIDEFYKRHPYVGPVIWITSLQFFVVQLIVALGWPRGYSVRANTISDLGNTLCELQGEGSVCSPWFAWMNASFVFLGFSMILGSLLLYHQFGRNRGAKLGFICMSLAGFGTVLVGLFPANISSTVHAIGA